ncbi:MAG: ATP-binding protein [Bifidobacteriaceae bacterium]|jgi:hypothetical protein|nr:ATP-binding protein [Bifidobacteriaceae bacterium]
MLIEFSFENWLSFRDRTALSMVASREKQHGERVSRVANPRLRLLPVAAIYGGNASGKTSLVEALAFAQDLVLRKTKAGGPLALRPFALDQDSATKPTRFNFQILAGERAYEYGFALAGEGVVEERLAAVMNSSEHVIFSRVGGDLALAPSLAKDQRLLFAFEGTDANQLYLNNAISQRLDAFRPVYDWFRSLRVIGPWTRFAPCELLAPGRDQLSGTMNQLLSELDTGIHELRTEPVAPDEIRLPKTVQRVLELGLEEGEVEGLVPPGGRAGMIATREDGRISLHKQVTRHIKPDGTSVTWDLDDESDGSRRLVDILPCFIRLAAPGAARVVVIDEIDRSLHTLLVRRILEWYLSTRTPESRAQLVFTTHDLLLMDQSIFRRDEIWVTERDAFGSSSLTAFSEYQDVRYDKDIRKSYLQGRLGGIPKILLGASPSAPSRS